jgi:hypothetical protein
MDTVGIHYGVGKHEWQLSPDDRESAVFWEWNSFCPGNIWNAAGKLAFAFTLLRIVVQKSHKRFLYVYITLLVIVELIQIFLNYFQCTPVKKLWDKTTPGHCWPPHVQTGYAVFKGVFIVVADAVLSLFPILIIRKLQASRKAKLGMWSLVGLGLLYVTHS